MSDYPQGTTTSIVVGIRADSRPDVTALDTDHGPRIHVQLDGHNLAFVGDPEPLLAFARALVTEVERAVPVDLLLTDWDKADEVTA